jgi:site-specific recombinase XerD
MKTIDQFLSHLVQTGKSPLTVRNYRIYLSKFLSVSSISSPDAITLPKIDAFQQYLASRGMSLLTQSYYLLCIRSFLKYCRIHLELPVLDPLRIELPKTNRKLQIALNQDETDRLLKVILFDQQERTTSEYSFLAKAVIELLVSSGIRVSELCGLKVLDIDFANKRFQVTGKGNKERVCFLNDRAKSAIMQYLKHKKTANTYLFTSSMKETTKPITPRSVQRIVLKYAKLAGIEKRVTPHALRRTFATLLLRKNVDIRYIQAFLGHNSIQTTQLYTLIERSDLEKIYELAQKKATKNIKDGEMVIVGKESLAKIRGTILQLTNQQKKLIAKLTPEEKPIVKKSIYKYLTIN